MPSQDSHQLFKVSSIFATSDWNKFLVKNRLWHYIRLPPPTFIKIVKNVYLQHISRINTFLISLPIAQSTSKCDDFWSSFPRITLQFVPSIMRSSSSLIPSNLSSSCKSEYLISLLRVAKLAILESRSWYRRKMNYIINMCHKVQPV